MLKIDLHTHTIASGHAFNTIYEMAEAARKRGVEILGITEHGPEQIGSAKEVYFECLDRVPKIISGVKVLFGAELNIINGKGNVDLSEETLKKLDFASVSFHSCGYVDQGEEKNTEVFIKALQNPHISVLTHIYKTKIKIPINVERVAEAACQAGKLLEISTTHFELDKINQERLNNLLKIIKIIKKNKFKILLGSDAHVESEIAVDKGFKENMKKLGLTDKDIANNDLKYLREFIKNI